MTALQRRTGPAARFARFRDPAPDAAGVPTTDPNSPVWAARFASAMLALAVGSLLGLSLTAIAIKNGRGVGETRVGAWRVSPQEGSPDPNPYQRAVFARTGALPMSNGQGIALAAVRDDAGRRLDLACTYSVSGPLPRARFWTLGVVDPDGYPLDNAADRQAFTSDDVVRDESGAFKIVLSAGVEPGNWLPLAGQGSFDLILRLYDSGVGPGSRALASLPVPAIIADRCP